MSGQALLNALIEATGLPQALIRAELEAVLKARGVSLERLTLEDVRAALEVYLQDTLVEAKGTSRESN